MAIDTDYLIEDCIESVKDRSFAPISQTTFQDADILRILNEEVTRVASRIMREREDFFLARKTTALVSGKDHYLLPAQAAGNALKALFLVGSGGDKRLLTRRDIDRLSEYSSGSGDSSSFYFEGDEVSLMQAPAASTGSLLFVYSRRPSRLALTTTCAKITGVSTAGTLTTFTVSTDLTASLSVGSSVDFVRSASPFLLWSEAVAITAITTTTIEVLASEIADVDGTVEPAILDYIAPTGYTNIPQLPIEFHPVLAQRGAIRLLLALGHTEKAQLAKMELREMEQEAIDLIQNRAESSPERPSRKRGLIATFRG